MQIIYLLTTKEIHSTIIIAANKNKQPQSGYLFWRYSCIVLKYL